MIAAVALTARAARGGMAMLPTGLPKAAFASATPRRFRPLVPPAIHPWPGDAGSRRCASDKASDGNISRGSDAVGGGAAESYKESDGKGDLRVEVANLIHELSKLERDLQQATAKATAAIEKLELKAKNTPEAKPATKPNTKPNTKLGSVQPKSIRNELYKDDLYWEDKPADFKSNYTWSDLPHVDFGVNQHMVINNELKEVLRQLLYEFRAPIMYAFAYGSGIFPQSKPGRRVSEEEFRKVHPKAPPPLVEGQHGNPKMIDFIFGVSHAQHWHSLNMRQHPDHYSSLAKLGSGAVSYVQEHIGAGVYFNPYVIVNGVLVKYGVTTLDAIDRDLSTWDNLYIAGRLQKPVKILRDHPLLRLSNQANLIAAVRTALLMLPERFNEKQLYGTVAGISYLGDPRMAFPTESPGKVSAIVDHNMLMFRRLYGAVIDNLPNLRYDDPAAKANIWLTDPDVALWLVQDMTPLRRANMVRRLPAAFRSRLYFQYRKKFGVSRDELDRLVAEARGDTGAEGGVSRRQGGPFDLRIANDDPAALRATLRRVIRQTINWPATAQSLKGVLTAGPTRTARYLGEKYDKWRAGKQKEAAAAKEDKAEKMD